jgi:plasmid stability protein
MRGFFIGGKWRAENGARLLAAIAGARLRIGSSTGAPARPRLVPAFQRMTQENTMQTTKSLERPGTTPMYGLPSIRDRRNDNNAIILPSDGEELKMATLLVRGIDESLVQRLREQAVANGRSAEAEHRAILAQALGGTRRHSFAEVLASMPDVGQDADFERTQDPGEAPRVFD